MVASKKWLLKGATPRKSGKAYPGYWADQDRKPFVPSAREEELLTRTVHIIDYLEQMDATSKRLETLEVRFNELCNMLSVQLVNSSFQLLEIRDAK